MKKLFLIPLMLLAALTLTTACSEDEPLANAGEQTSQGTEEGEGDDTDDGNDADGDSTTVTGSRYLVVYCSRTGNTERMAQTIQAALQYDMTVVEPETPYDTDYNDMLDRARAELDAISRGEYPAISTTVESFDGYDIVFVGYPIWFSHMATPMQTFLHNHAGLLAGSRIALFASSGSSGMSTSERDAAALVPDATYCEPLLLTSSTLGDMDARISTWLETLGVTATQDVRQ